MIGGFNTDMDGDILKYPLCERKILEKEI